MPKYFNLIDYLIRFAFDKSKRHWVLDIVVLFYFQLINKLDCHILHEHKFVIV